MINWIKKLDMVYDKLQDQKSKNLFNIRVEYFIDEDLNKLEKKLLKINEAWEEPDFEQFMDNMPSNIPICIWGAGQEGKRTWQLLNSLKRKYSVKAFCDSNNVKWGTNLYNIPIISPYELYQSKDNYIVLIASKSYVSEIYEELLIHQFPRNKIFYPSYRRLIASSGLQYFDLPQLYHSDNEIFIDAGTYDGRTTLEFIKWCKNDYRKIYAFEPSSKSAANCRMQFQKNNITNIQLLEAGVWNKNDKLRFLSNSSAGAAFHMGGDTYVPVVCIDDVVGNDKVTFIKMDVEGCELNALIGAKNTIIRNKPKLAICIYHKPQDIITIPSYILSLIPNYRFYIRHYASNYWETVLYAI